VCSYCGCESITVIGRFMSEHEQIVNACGALRRAAVTGDGAAAAGHATELATLLDGHTAAEEQGLFSELRLEPEFTEHVDRLCAEHGEIGARLGRILGGDLTGIDALHDLLRRHIDREDNALFPAAAIALDGPAWERVTERTAPPPAAVTPGSGSRA
jgi:hemerythrin-like domain-containing protein